MPQKLIAIFSNTSRYYQCLGFLALLLALAFPAFAQSTNAEIAIPLAADNNYNIDSNPQQIQISFSKPLQIGPFKLHPDLSRMISSSQLSADQKQLTLHTAQPLSFSSHRDKGHLIIKLQPDTSKQNPDGQVDLPSLNLTFGEHPDFFRFAFEYQEKPLYTIKTDGQSTTLYFLNSLSLRTAQLEKYPYFSSLLQTKNPMGGINFKIPSPLVKSSEYNSKIIIDVSKMRGFIQSPPADATEETKKNDNIQKLRSISEKTQISLGQVFIPRDQEQIISLSFAWNIPTGISVFNRGGYIWIVFDHRQKLDLEEINKTVEPFVSEVLNIPHTKGTVLRLTPKTEIKADVRKEGLLWIVDLFRGKNPELPRDMTLFTQYDALKRPYFFIPSSNFGNVISVVDPEVGDTISTVPTSELHVGINNMYDYPDLSFLQSAQGLALVPKSSDLMMERGNTGIMIRGINRSLNISPDLDALKRHQSLAEAVANSEAFDLLVPPQLLSKNFNDAIDQLTRDLQTVPPEQKALAQLNLIKYYISQGMGTNALSIIRQLESDPAYRNSEHLRTLRGIANFLTKRYDQAIADFSFGSLPTNDEAVFWRAIASSAQKYKPEDNIILISFISLIKDYPQPLKEKIAAIGAKTALLAGDDISAQNFIDILKTGTYNDLYTDARLNYLATKRRTLQGYPRNAVKLYRLIAPSEALKYSALARFENALLSQRLGVLSLDKAIEELERLRFSWGEKNFKLQVLNTLADLYIRNGDYYNALRSLNQTLPLQGNRGKEATLNQMTRIFEDIYINNRADDMPILKSLALYNDFEWLAPRSPKYNEIIQKLADRLVSVDLMPRALQLLNNQMKYNQLDPLEKSKVGTRLALINLFEDNPHDALRILDQTELATAPETLRAHRKIIRAKILSDLGQVEAAIKLLNEDYSRNALLLKSEIYWNGQQWDLASDTIRHLVEKPIEGKALSPEQISFILDWATALNKAGKTTVLVRLRNKFLPFFENTKYYSTFSILTSNLENDKIDLKAINQTINDVTAFRNFTKIYNDSLKNNSLSETIK